MLPADFFRAMEIVSRDRLFLEEKWELLTGDWQGNMPFPLEMTYFRKMYPLCRGPFPLEQVVPYAEEVVRLCREHPALRLFAHICLKGAYGKPEFFFSSLNVPQPFLGEKYTGMFFLMIALGVYPFMEKAYAELGIPEQYADDAMAWIGGTMYPFREGYGDLPGCRLDLPWLAHYPKNTLFRIGRLEFLLDVFPSWMPAVFVDPAGEVKALCGDGWQLRADGRIAEPEEDEVFMTARLKESRKSVSGTLIRPDGTVEMKKECTLDRKIWKPAAAPWDLFPTIHIPGGERMPFEEIVRSLQKAGEFFKTYLHREVPFFGCWSWILNPIWEELLPHSNMVRFRREMYAFPTKSWGKKSGMTFLFGRNDKFPEELPARNRAQRAMQEASRRHDMGTGGVFVMTGDIDKLGAEYYRKKQSFPGGK